MKKYEKLYMISKLIVLLTIIYQIIINQQKLSIFACIVTFFLLDVLYYIKKKNKDKLITRIIYVLTISIIGLNIIQNFFDVFKGWDTVMHTLTGFISATLFIYVFRKLKINYKFMLLAAFCFSMTVGIIWEQLEFTYDYIFLKDSQKDRIVTKFQSGLIEKGKDITIKDIKYTIIYSGNNLKETKINGYLDIGIIDTMKDLNVNLLGAIIGLIISISYVKKK